MPRPYSSDLRSRVLAGGKSSSQPRQRIAERFQLAPATLYNSSGRRLRRTTPEVSTTARDYDESRRCEFLGKRHIRKPQAAGLLDMA